MISFVRRQADLVPDALQELQNNMLTPKFITLFQLILKTLLIVKSYEVVWVKKNLRLKVKGSHFSKNMHH